MPTKDLKTSLGFENNESVLPQFEDVLPIIQLKLLSSGFKIPEHFGLQKITEHSADLVRKINSKFRAYPAPLCPTDQICVDGQCVGGCASGESGTPKASTQLAPKEAISHGAPDMTLSQPVAPMAITPPINDVRVATISAGS